MDQTESAAEFDEQAIRSIRKDKLNIFPWHKLKLQL